MFRAYSSCNNAACCSSLGLAWVVCRFRAVTELKNRGIETVMLTGDRVESAQRVCTEVIKSPSDVIFCMCLPTPSVTKSFSPICMTHLRLASQRSKPV